MPQTINGIGTWYWGKDNLITRNGACEFCGKQVELKSYDTTLYLVAVYIPLIPLGRKRVFDACPKCRRHRVVPLSKWQQMRADAIVQVSQAWQANRKDPEKAAAVVNTIVGFHDPQSFRDIAPVIGDAFQHDADVQLLLAGAHDHFGETASAEGAYRAACKIRNDDRSNAGFANFLLRQQRPAEAEPLLKPALNNRNRPFAPLLLALAQSYQSVGENDRAARIVDDVGTAFPDLLSDPGYERVRKSTSKYAGTNRKVKTPGLDHRGEGIKKSSWMARYAAIVLLGGLLLIAAIGYFALAYSLGTHSVLIVSGAPVAYDVNINGRRVRLPAESHTSLDLPEGPIVISPADQSQLVQPGTMRLETSFWSRPFHRRTFVLNPDRLAVIVWEQTEYAAKNNFSSEDQPQSLRANGEMYDFAAADYLFQEFPKSVTLSSDTSRVHKTRVTSLTKLLPHERASLIRDEMGAPAARDWVQRYAPLCQNDLESERLMEDFLEPNALIAFLRPRLDDRPVRVEWHREYQAVIQRQQPDYDVSREYRKRLSAHPDDAKLQYLLGRVLPERDEQLKLFNEAASAAQPCAYAIFALSYDSMQHARFADALVQIRRARALEPDNLGFQYAEIDTLNALGQFDSALELIRALEQHDQSFSNYAIEIGLLAGKRDLPQARLRVAAYAKSLSDLGAPPDKVEQARNWLQTDLFYATGDIEGYRKLVAAIQTDSAKFLTSVVDSHCADAWKILSKSEPDLISDLAVYLAARRAHDDATSALAWSGAIDLLKHGDRGDRALASALSDPANPPDGPIMENWTSQSTQRSIMYAALGLRFPQRQEEYFAQARPLNYGHHFPALLIRNITETASK
jgi:predicted Zn-dependent protease